MTHALAQASSERRPRPQLVPAPPAVSVVVPVRDEAANVGPLVAEIGAALEGRECFEAVFVDDASTDDTLAELRRLQEARPWLRVIAHGRGAGQSAAIASGVAAARGALIATMDGDGQNDPADIPPLLAAFREGAFGMVIGERRERHDTAIRRLSSRIANGVRRGILGDGTADTGCGLKVFPRSLFLALPFFDHMHRFLPALVSMSGHRVAALPVGHRPRLRGRSKYGIGNRLWVGLIDLAGVVWLKRRRVRRGTVTEIERPS